MTAASSLFSVVTGQFFSSCQRGTTMSASVLEKKTASEAGPVSAAVFIILFLTPSWLNISGKINAFENDIYVLRLDI